MNPRIETISEKKLIGHRQTMTFTQNRTTELWKGFMPLRNTIQNKVTTNLISLQVYHDGFSFQNFNSHAPFEKWAAVEVDNFNHIPSGMETFLLPGGLYAVFLHRGAALTGAQTFQYIFGTWLPASGYRLDSRPHFEILGERYKNNHPDSEEEIWIPVELTDRQFITE